MSRSALPARTLSRLRWLACALLFPLAFAGSARAQGQVPAGFMDEAVVGPLNCPVGMAFVPDGRLLVTELQSARIRLVVGTQLGLTDPLMTVDSVQAGGERGLLGIAVDPRWPAKPYVYVFFDASRGPTLADSTIRVQRFTASGDLSDPESRNLTLDPASRREVLRGLPDLNDNHNGGTIRFGNDGMLYVSLAEDAYGCLAVDPANIHGVILRVDVTVLPDTPGGALPRQQLVPADNPYAADASIDKRLVWSWGFRNPFRFSVDVATGNLMVADVGFTRQEEVDVANAGGIDFGWPYYEGDQTLVTTGECGPLPPPGLTGPVYVYDRTELGGGSTAIIGGSVYNHLSATDRFPDDYVGDYFFSDFYAGILRRLKKTGSTWSLAPPVNGQPNASDWGHGFNEVTDWALSPQGGLYYCRMTHDFATCDTPTGEIRRIVHPDLPSGVDPRPPAAIAFATFPTPARGAVTLAFTLPRAARVEVAIVDVGGRTVRRLAPAGTRAAGSHRVAWDGKTESGAAASPGVYRARLVVDGRPFELKVPLIP